MLTILNVEQNSISVKTKYPNESSNKKLTKEEKKQKWSKSYEKVQFH